MPLGFCSPDKISFQKRTIPPQDIIFPTFLLYRANSKLYWILHLRIMYQKNGRLRANSNYEQKLVTTYIRTHCNLVIY